MVMSTEISNWFYKEVKSPYEATVLFEVGYEDAKGVFHLDKEFGDRWEAHRRLSYLNELEEMPTYEDFKNNFGDVKCKALETLEKSYKVYYNAILESRYSESELNRLHSNCDISRNNALFLGAITNNQFHYYSNRLNELLYMRFPTLRPEGYVSIGSRNEED